MHASLVAGVFVFATDGALPRSADRAGVAFAAGVVPPALPPAFHPLPREHRSGWTHQAAARAAATCGNRWR